MYKRKRTSPPHTQTEPINQEDLIRDLELRENNRSYLNYTCISNYKIVYALIKIILYYIISLRDRLNFTKSFNESCLLCTHKPTVNIKTPAFPCYFKR